MKKALRIILPILLTIVIVCGIIWYLFDYDRAFTQDILLSLARTSEKQGNNKIAAWFYGLAYTQSGNNDKVALELAEQYIANGNYTKAEFTLTNAIKDGGGIDLYIALCNTFVAQDKLLDAVNMLDGISNSSIKQQIDQLRPAAPTASSDSDESSATDENHPGFIKYSNYANITLSTTGGTIYASVLGQYPSIADGPYTKPITLVDGENCIYALSVADNGLVSKISVFNYIVGDVIKLVEFEDPTIEASIRKLLNVSENTPIYSNDLWAIKEYIMPEEAQSNSDLRYMVYLEKLTIQNGQSDDFSFLASLPRLKELTITNNKVSKDTLSLIGSLSDLQRLTLSNCGLTNITDLGRAKNLIYLDLNENSIHDISSLSALANLTELNLHRNPLSDLSALSSLSKLIKLDVSSNKHTSLASIGGLTSLQWLNAGDNNIESVDTLVGLDNLTHLYLNDNAIEDISVLSAFTKIIELNIASNAITDITSLSTLTQMTYFDFSRNLVSVLPEFEKDCQLVTIDGTENLLTNIDCLGGLLHLNIVNMDYNVELASIVALAECPLLIEVNVYGTNVQDVQALTDQSIIVNYTPV